MFPRRGGRKVGDKRIDAAIDALVAFGFEKSTIRKTVNQLLKVYDGEWRFIEDASYTLVIDTILQEESEQQKDNPENKEDDNSGELPRVTGVADIKADHIREADKAADDGVGDDHWVPQERDQVTECKGESSSTKDEKYRREPCYGWISEDDFDDMFDNDERAANQN